jgi:hypothetical protein
MHKTKYIWNPAAFLLDTGLLFEINRRVLHPFGLDLTVNLPRSAEEEERVTGVSTVSIWDCRDNPEEFSYDKETFLTEQSRFRSFELKHSILSELRQDSLGYTIQGHGLSESTVKRAYTTYRDSMGQVSPKWGELSEKVRQAWRKAAEVVKNG